MIGAGYYPAGVTTVSGEVVWTVVVAGGGGSRYGGPKQYEQLGAGRVLDLAVATARRASDGVVVVVPAADAPSEGAVAGGSTRSESVRNGLAAVPPEATIVCVHDAARPLASSALFAAVVDAVCAGADAVVPAVPVTDTVKVVDERGTVVATPDRATLVAVQTPQGFRASVLRRAHAGGGDGTDDAALVERAGGRVVTVPGEPWNRKITEPDDLTWSRQWLADHADQVRSR
jgi:2-C-methyl-D-erythritol 4-phosphate cytidylyltransferase